jgi:putative tryptophan/tyrosine transport system substrate-binding protein
MRRREFIAGIGSAAAWPIGLRAQDTAVVVGVISPFSADANATSRFSRLLREGLKQDVIVEYRGEANGLARQKELANDLVRRHVTVILAQAGGPALAAKSATSTIPIVFFGIGADPVELGLVDSINRPGANVQVWASIILLSKVSIYCVSSFLRRQLHTFPAVQASSPLTLISQTPSVDGAV